MACGVLSHLPGKENPEHRKEKRTQIYADQQNSVLFGSLQRWIQYGVNQASTGELTME